MSPVMADWTATLAAVRARGPRCDRCNGWTFRPEYLRMPRYIARLCPECLPLGPESLRIKALVLCQIFRSDLPRYGTEGPVRLV